MATRKDHFGCHGELFWLARGTVLVGQGSRIEATQNLPDVRFLDIRFLFLSFAYASAKRECNAVSTIADESWQISWGWKPHEDHDTAEAKFLQPSMRLRYNYYVQLVATRRDWMRVPNLKIWSARQRGVEAGRAHHCMDGVMFYSHGS